MMTLTMNLIYDDFHHENSDRLWKRCRHCNKYFKAQKAYFICCSWNCQTKHKNAMAELDRLDRQPYAGHPF